MPGSAVPHAPTTSEMREMETAARLWARSGAMALTGRSDGAPVVAPAALALATARDAASLGALAQRAGNLLALDGAALLGERAACTGLRRRGRRSAGGSARLVRARDGWLALNLPRPDDRAALPAWLASDPIDAIDPWAQIESIVRERDASEWIARARLLGLAVAEAVAPDPAPPPAVRRLALGTPRERAGRARPLVLDLSSLWAGPLCASLLGAAGARVVKVESVERPDGARFGPPPFFDLLNAGKESVAIALATPQGVDALRRLLAAADVVIESARPRALRHLGIDAETLVAETPGLTWVSITGYGRADPACEWVAFGDDAACAAGLAWVAGRDDDGPLFCADAVADPLTGLRAAVAALAAWRAGGGVLLDVSLRGVAAEAIVCTAPPDGTDEPVAAPRARRAAGTARPLGADGARVFSALRPARCR